MASAEQGPSTYVQMMSLITGFWVSQVVRTAADLSLAEHLADGPQSAQDIADLEGSDPDSTFRLMRACVSLGMLTYADGRFAAAPLLATLHGGASSSLKYFALAQTAPGHWLTWGRTSEAVREGGTQSKAALGQDIFQYLGEHTEEAGLFSKAMTNLSAPVIAEAVDVIDVSDVADVVDVGGANGTFVQALLAAHPHLRGTVLELPHVVPGALVDAERNGLSDRFTAVAGDFFREIPEGDVHLLKFVMHDFDDERCVQILRRCREALRPGGRVIVVEMLTGEPGEGGFAPLMDIAMLTMLTGRERNLPEFDRLFAAAGLRRIRATRVQEPFAVIEAVAA